VHTTGSFTVCQLNSRQKSFVAFGNVPIADDHGLDDRTLTVLTKEATAVIQFLELNLQIGGQ
jgi:hypothetical protein